MNLSMLAHHIHNLRVSLLKENLMFIPEHHTIWLTPEEWDKCLNDEETILGMNPEERLKFSRGRKFLGVNIAVVKDHPSPLRA